METRVVRELDTALATLPEIVAQKAPGFEEKDMRAILFTEFRCVLLTFLSRVQVKTVFSRVSHVFLTCFSLVSLFPGRRGCQAM